jgi:steroid delta-isomerase-like uncharacterized protein
MAREENAALFQRMIDEMWNGRRLEVADELFASDAPNNIPIAPNLPPGPDGAKALANLLLGAFPDLQISVDRVVTSDDRVAGRLLEQGTHQGDFLGVAGTGKAVDFTRIGLFRIENGKIAESWYEFDSLRVMQQIGAIPGGG